MRTLSDKLIIKITEKEQKTNSGIILAEHKEQSRLVRDIFSNEATIEYISKEDAKRYGIEQGDTVIFSRWGAQLVDDERAVISGTDILAKFENLS